MMCPDCAADTAKLSATSGNIGITDTVAAAQFVVLGMSGGVGGNCLAGTGCNGATVCAA